MKENIKKEKNISPQQAIYILTDIRSDQLLNVEKRKERKKS